MMVSLNPSTPKVGPQAPVMAITIPTFNRGKLLGNLLDSIARDFTLWPSDLEVVVLDNASTDDTCVQVQKRIAQGMPIRLLSNTTNIGMDGNLAACFEVTSAKYLWQIGDDEILHGGACRYVLEFCRSNDFGLLHIECVGFSQGKQSEQLTRTIPSKIDVRPLDSSAMFRRANIYLTFISSNVINRQVVRSHDPTFDPRAEMNTFLPHLAWIYGALKATSQHFHVRTPLFSALGGNTSGYRLVEVFGVNLQAITARQLGARLPRARRLMANAVLTRLLPGELMALSHAEVGGGNRFEPEHLGHALDQAFAPSPYLRLWVRPLLSVQGWRRRVVFLALRVFNKINRTLNYALL